MNEKGLTRSGQGWFGRQLGDGLISSFVQIAGVWLLSDLGYYLLLPSLGIDLGYNASPIPITVYYLFWVGVAVILFWPVYVLWAQYARWPTFENRLASLAIWTLAFAGSVAFVGYVIPALPQIVWKESWAPDFVKAGSLYFLPKSADIVFQQLLIVALTVVLAARSLSLLKISLLTAAMFGGTHVLLIFGDVPVLYVARFMVSASLFGLLFPYLILRVRHGLAYSYMAHWGYYALSVVLPHVFLSSGSQ